MPTLRDRRSPFDSVATDQSDDAIPTPLPHEDLVRRLADAATTLPCEVVEQSGPTLLRRLTQLSGDSGPTVARRAGSGPLDDRLLWILDAPPLPNEPPPAMFARKERELGNAFADLTADQAGRLHARLSLRLPADLVAMKFARLSAERRTRLLVFLRLCAERG
jgi:hypothetical protein